MRQTLTPRTRRLLDIQGFDAVDVQELAPVALGCAWRLRLCALLCGVGIILASPTILLVLTAIAALAARRPCTPSTSSTTTVSARVLNLQIADRVHGLRAANGVRAHLR